ncbi:MAG: hypothetical protein U0232_22210 [Thermomicrobiales bacterium]
MGGEVVPGDGGFDEVAAGEDGDAEIAFELADDRHGGQGLAVEQAAEAQRQVGAVEGERLVVGQAEAVDTDHGRLGREAELGGDGRRGGFLGDIGDARG